MKIPLTLNGKKIILTSEPTDSLMHILRKEQFYSVKCGCEKGICGNCLVLMDGNPVPSCKIPMGIIRDSNIVTLEYLKTDPLYQDIMSGFSQAGIHMCGYCNAGNRGEKNRSERLGEQNDARLRNDKSEKDGGQG